MEEFRKKVESFFSELGLSSKKTTAFLESGSKDYRAFLSQKGARKLGYQKDLRSAVRHRGLILPGVKLIITAITPEGYQVVLAQESEHKELTFPSDGIAEWLYFGKTAIESPTLAAYRKLFEVIGKNIDFDPKLTYMGEQTSTCVQENRDIIYEISLFFKAEVPYELIQKVESKGKWRGFLHSIEPML